MTRPLCSRCGLPVRLRKDGTAGKHEDIDVSGGRYAGVRWAVCPGTGELPREPLTWTQSR